MLARKRTRPALSIALVLMLAAALPAYGHPDDGSGDGHELTEEFLDARDRTSHLTTSDDLHVISEGPSAKVIKNLEVAGRGQRLEPGATTDVWAHNRFAYTGTFNNPCGGEEGGGVWIWDVRNKNKPSFVGIIDSPTGSRSNDVKVDTMNSGDILVHSNEPCAGGPGGFEIYDVDDPRNPEHLASVRIDELNEITPFFFLPGTLEDVGVHNLFLFTQGERDYVSAVSEGVFHNFRTYDITDPSNPELVNAWGAEELFDPGVGGTTLETDPTGERTLDAVLWLLDGFGSSANRFLHDITVDESGTQAYLSNWDAGLVLLDLSAIGDPQVVSVALNPEEGSLDGEVNSHAAWPSEDGSIVVETEEDFSAWVTVQPPGNLTFGEGDPAAPLPGTAVATVTGDDFEGSQTGNAGTVAADSLEVTSGPLAGNTYPAIELAGDQPKFGDVGPVSGDIVWIGQACDGDPILNEGAIVDGGIAIVRRGVCTFREKNFNAAAAGADAIVIANNLTDNTPWGGVRIWDYSDPANPVLASTFDTVCSAASDPFEAGCDPFGTYSVHNVVVETTGNKVKAYISWYFDGMLVLEVTDPYNPVEVARFFDNSPEFLEANGGQPHDFWGVWKEPNQPWIYGSDRNGGLYVFREQGSGSG